MTSKNYDEVRLPDSHPVHDGFHYVANGVPIRAWFDGTVADLKKIRNYTEIYSCDIIGRGIDTAGFKKVTVKQ